MLPRTALPLAPLPQSRRPLLLHPWRPAVVLGLAIAKRSIKSRKHVTRPTRVLLVEQLTDGLSNCPAIE